MESQSRTPSDSNDLIAQKEELIATLKERADSQTQQITSLRKQVEMQIVQIQLQDEEVTKWKKDATALIESSKTKDQTIQKQQQQIQTQQQQIQAQQQQIQTQQQQIQTQNEQINHLKKTIEDQSKQIQLWFKTVEQMQKLPKNPPIVGYNSAPSDLQNMLRNPGTDATVIPIVSPNSPEQAAPDIPAGNPAFLQLPLTNPNNVVPGRPLPSAANGPSPDVTFPMVGQGNGKIVVAPHVPDQYNINSYGRYEVTIFGEDQQTILVSTCITVVPEPKICVPKQFVIKDALNNIVVGGRVTLKRKDGSVVFTGVTNHTGNVYIRQKNKMCFYYYLKNNSLLIYCPFQNRRGVSVF
jgi:hypothetical protein